MCYKYSYQTTFIHCNILLQDIQGNRISYINYLLDATFKQIINQKLESTNHKIIVFNNKVYTSTLYTRSNIGTDKSAA